MIRVNLLPHREEKRKARLKQFVGLAVLSALLATIVAILAFVFLDSQISEQRDSRNKYLSDEISKLDKQIEEIGRIRTETAALLAKKQVVEGLQSNRSEPVYLLDQMLRQLPEGLYLKSIKQEGTKVAVSGYAQSQARVANFMRTIEASPYLENPILGEIKAVTVNGQRVNEFNLTFLIKRAKSDFGGKGGAPRKAESAKPAEKKP